MTALDYAWMFVFFEAAIGCLFLAWNYHRIAKLNDHRYAYARAGSIIMLFLAQVMILMIYVAWDFAVDLAEMKARNDEMLSLEELKK